MLQQESASAVKSTDDGKWICYNVPVTLICFSALIQDLQSVLRACIKQNQSAWMLGLPLLHLLSKASTPSTHHALIAYGIKHDYADAPRWWGITALNDAVQNFKMHMNTREL